MSILLSHTTALETLRRWDLRKRLVKGERCDATVPAAADDLDRALEAGSFLGSLARPLDLLVSDRRAAHAAPDVVAHLQSGPLPAGSAIALSDDILCSSPEQVVIQMAPRLTQTELAYLLSELMGTYAICPAMEDGMFQRDAPLTTPERVLEHLGRLGRRPGVRQVRAALERACVLSGSPRETKLAMRLAFKPALGGYHLNVLAMNEPIKVAHLGSRLGEGVRKPDVLLGACEASAPYSGVSFDYNGRVHELPGSLERDIRRQNELLAIGFKNYVLTKALYDDLDYMDDIVARARIDLGLPRLHLMRDESMRRRRLRLALYLELERMDGVTWHGKESGPCAEGVCPVYEEPFVEVVPIEAYGLE